MNIRDMQRNFMIKLRQFVEEPEVESDDIEYYLNRAQDEYVKEQHFVIRDSYRNQQLGNIDIQKAVENLRTLVNTEIYEELDLTTGVNIENSLIADVSELNPEYSYYLRSRFKSDGTALNCKVIDPIMLSKYTVTKYNKPLYREPAVLLEGNDITVIYPTDTNIDNPILELHYITHPVSMSISENQNCTLPIHTHNEIVDRAVEFKINDLQRSRSLGIDKGAAVQQPQQPQQQRSE